MKKIFSILTVLLLVGSLFAQARRGNVVDSRQKTFSLTEASASIRPVQTVEPVRDAVSSITEGFEGATFPPTGWTMLDVDGDGQNWFSYSVAGTAHTGTRSAASASWFNNAVLTPNNYLITPQIAAVNGMVLNWWASGQDPDYPDEHYQVKVSTTGTAAANFTDVIFEETFTDAVWHERNVDLSVYAGQNIYIAFVHNNSTDVFYMKIDDVQVFNAAGCDLTSAITGLTPSISGNNIVLNWNINNTPDSYVLNVNGVDLPVTIDPSTTTYTYLNAPDGIYDITLTALYDGCPSVSASVTEFQKGEMCDVLTVVMHDSYGDGWNGNAVALVQNGLTIMSYATLTSGANGTATLQGFLGNYDIYFIVGSYASEVSFEILDLAGTQVYASTLGALTTQTLLFSDVNDCGVVAGVDVAVTAITPNVDGMNYSATETVTASVKNWGDQPITGFTLSLVVNEGTPIVETFTGSIESIATGVHTFAAKADLSAVGNHTIKVTVTAASDLNATNNEMEVSLNNAVCPTENLPLNETFDNPLAECWTINPATGNALMLNPTTNDYLPASPNGNFFGWNDDAAGSGSAGYCTSSLLTPPLDLTSASAVRLRFNYYFRPFTGESFKVKVNGTEVFTGVQTAAWTPVEVNLSDFAGLNNVRVEFYYTDGNAWGGGLGFDDIIIDEPAAVDAVLTSMPSPVTGYGLTATETVKVVVRNDGGTPITALDFYLIVDEGAPVAENASGLNIAYGDIYEYTFAAKADLSTIGNHSVKVTIDIAGDANEANNVIEKTVECKDASQPMSPDFENNVEDFDIVFPGWVQHNVDASPASYGWDGVSFPNSAYSGSYIAFNPSACVPSQLSTIAPHSGDRFAACFQGLNPGVATVVNNDWLITPKYTLADNATEISLWVAQLTNNYSGGERFNVLISTTTTDVTAFTKLNTSAYETISGTTTWEQKSYNVSAYAGQAVHIAVQCVSTDEFIFMVDDITVPVSTGIVTIGFEESVVSIYPNPSKDVVTINSPVAASVNVFDVTGKLVNNFKLEANTNYQFAQSAGIYFLNINGETHKVVFE